MRRAGAVVAVVAAAAVGSCLRDVTGPGGGWRTQLALAPAFESTVAGRVDFDRVRVTVMRPAGGRTVADTVIAFPADVDSVELAVVVPLEESREDFLVFIRLITATGDTVFRNEPYPQTVTAVAGSRSAFVQALLRYVGIGADAVAVTIAPPDTVVGFGQSVDLAAQAVGTDQLPISGTPLVWSSLDPLLLAVPDPAVGRVLGGSQRGTARVVAQLLTGPADTALVTVQPSASLLALVSGDGQQGTPGSLLTVPLRVRVTAADGLGVRVPVAFHAVTTGVAVTDSLVASDAAGFAQTFVRLGPVAATYTVEAVVAGLPPVMFTAVAATPIATVTVTPDTLTFDALGDTAQLTAQALNAAGSPVAATFTWASSDQAVATIDSATGIMVVLGNGTTTITATAHGVPGSAAASVLQVATQLVFSTQPGPATAGMAITPAVVVSALDRRGNVARNFVDSVSLVRADSVTCLGPLGTTQVGAVAGIATFADLLFQQACASLQFRATIGGATSAPSDPFDVLPGPAAALTLVAGDGQVDSVAATLATPLQVRVTDQYGNGVAGYPIGWAVTAGGGSLFPSASTTDAAGVSSTPWTLGVAAGVQRVQARAGTLAGSPVTFTATANPGAAAKLAFLVPPSDAMVLQAIAPPVEVGVTDQFGNRVSWAADVIVQLGKNPLGIAVLAGTMIVPTDAAGVARFADLVVDLAASGYTLVASSPSLQSDESKPFNITVLPAGPVFAGDSAGDPLAGGIFRVTPDGTVRSRLSERGPSGNVHPRWSPDRSRVAFTSQDLRTGPSALYVVDEADLTLATLVTDTSTRRPRWNADGTHLAFECGPVASPAQQDVCVIRDVAVPVVQLEGKGAGRIVVTDVGDRLDGPGAFAWDPKDPGVLVVVRDQLDAKQDTVSQLLLVSFDGQLLQYLSGPLIDPDTQLPLHVVGTLDWAADGTIVFAAQDPLAFDPGAPTGRRLYAFNQNDLVLRQITKGPAFDLHPVVSPDGRQVLFQRDGACSTDYWVIGTDGTGEVRVSAEALCDVVPGALGHDWSPDGKDIVLVGADPLGTAGDLAIYVVPAGTTWDVYPSSRRLIGRSGETPGLVTDIQPSWRP